MSKKDLPVFYGEPTHGWTGRDFEQQIFAARDYQALVQWTRSGGTSYGGTYTKAVEVITRVFPSEDVRCDFCVMKVLATVLAQSHEASYAIHIQGLKPIEPSSLPSFLAVYSPTQTRRIINAYGTVIHSPDELRAVYSKLRERGVPIEAELPDRIEDIAGTIETFLRCINEGRYEIPEGLLKKRHSE